MQNCIHWYSRLRLISRHIGWTKVRDATACFSSLSHADSVYEIPNRYVEDGLFDTNVEDLNSFMEYMSKSDTLPLIASQQQDHQPTRSSTATPTLTATMPKEKRVQLVETLKTNPPSSLADFVYFIQALMPYHDTHIILSKLLGHLYAFDQRQTAGPSDFLDTEACHLLVQKCFALFPVSPFDAYHMLQFLARPFHATGSALPDLDPSVSSPSSLGPIANKGLPLVWLLAKYGMSLPRECYFALFKAASKYPNGPTQLYSYLKDIETLYRMTLPTQVYFIAFYDFLNRQPLAQESDPSAADSPRRSSTLKSNEVVDAMYQACVAVCKNALSADASSCKSYMLVKSIYHAYLVRSQRIQVSLLIFKQIMELFGPVIVANPSLMYRFLSRYLLAGHLKEALLVLQSYESLRPGLVATEPTLCSETLRLLSLFPGKISTADLHPFLALVNPDHLPAVTLSPTGSLFHYWHVLLKYEPSILLERLNAAYASHANSLSPLMLTFLISVYVGRLDKTSLRLVGDWAQSKLSLPSTPLPLKSMDKAVCISGIFEKFHTRLFQVLRHAEDRQMGFDGYALAKIIEWLYTLSDWKSLNELVFAYRKDTSEPSQGLEDLVSRVRVAKVVNIIFYSLVSRNEWLVVSELVEIMYPRQRADPNTYHHCLIIKQCIRARYGIRKYLTSTSCYLPDSEPIESLLQHLVSKHLISSSDALQLAQLFKEERRLFFVGQLRTILRRPPEWFQSRIQPNLQQIVQEAIRPPVFFSLTRASQ